MDVNDLNERAGSGLMEKLMTLRPIDDMFFRLLSGRKEVCQEILGILLEDESISVTDSYPQFELVGMNRSVILDALCVLSDKRFVNIEVQKDHFNDDIKRTRFHASLMTVNYTDKTVPFSKLPDVEVVYISEYNVVKTKKPVSRVLKGIKNEYGGFEEIHNGEGIVFATPAVKDDSKKSRLLQRMVDDTAFWDVEFPVLSEAVNYFKHTKEGNHIMCKLAEELRDEGRKEGRKEGLYEGKIEIIQSLIKDGILTLEEAIKRYGFSEQEIRKCLNK